VIVAELVSIHDYTILDGKPHGCLRPRGANPAVSRRTFLKIRAPSFKRN